MNYNGRRFKNGLSNMPHNESEFGFDVEHSGTRQLIEYWSGLRGGRSAPFKSEVTARGIGRHLASNTFILESLGHGVHRFRLAGSFLHDIFGLELRGMSALSIMQKDSRSRYQSLIEECLSAPAIGVILCKATTPNGTESNLEIALTPLRNDFDQLNRILGSVHEVPAETDQPMQTSPRQCRILNARTFVATGPNQFQVSAPMPGFGEPGSGFDFERPGLSTIEGGAQTGERRRGHLKVVKE